MKFDPDPVEVFIWATTIAIIVLLAFLCVYVGQRVLA